MICDTCERRMGYCFYINDEHWLRAVGKTEGYQCAHCVLEALGGLDWMIIWNEPTERIRMNVETTKEDGLEQEPKRTRGHVSYCKLEGDHERDCPIPLGASPTVRETGLQTLLQRIAEASIYDPGETDLDDEQPVTVRGITLGDVRLARRLVR